MGKNLKIFFEKTLDPETKLYFIGIIFTCLLGETYILINRLFFHFTGVFYVPAMWLLIAPLVLTFLIVALCFEEHAPRMGYFTKTYTTYFFIFLALSIMSTGIQYTPFPTIDAFLVKVDQWMGFYTLPVLNWTYAHPAIKTFFIYCYSALGMELIFLPLIVAFLMDKSAIRIYFLSMMISYLIGMNIYYFFPTAGPTMIFKSPHFLSVQHDTFLKFFEVHHRLLLTTVEGGMIAFPSFHVIWAFFMIYLCRHIKWLFYPVLLLNIGVILATIFLGWHYLTDLIAGILLAIGSIALAHQISRNWLSS